MRKLKAILHPSKRPDEIQRLHIEDESTKWFGVARDFTGRPNFEDYGRYANLMASISPIESLSNRYPQLVSFIGVTNAGKSTLIKMLVNHETDGTDPETSAMFPSPVVGSVVNDALPTSGDVHLYADPTTHTEQLPILYADCEGFEGGERTPLGARSRRRRRSDAARDQPPDANVHIRPILWAQTEEARQREYAVTALYPRLLYTFSDCVVFVLRNPKTFQSAVLTKLLEWGVSALEKSINQPALPHCIVALNSTDPGVDEREWDIDYATQSLLSTVSRALDYVEGVPRFRELAEHWRSLGKHIFTVEDLILRYYSSFKVVRIPARPRYTTINEQISKLHEVIKKNCEDSFRSKRRARMLTNADELNTYLQSGFDHFTTHLDLPFNFMEVSLLRNPIPNDFGGHILQLCTTLSSQQPNHQPGRVAWMFEKLSVMLASCVLLDCARFRKGRVDELFGNYEKFFDYAMGEYLELHYPCSYVSPDGSRHCKLVRARHLPKGHQDEQGIIAAGDYEAAFDSSFVQLWKAQLRSAIEGLHRDFSYELEQASQIDDMNVIPEERIALDLHADYLNQFFEAVGPAASICSHATCFCCLMDVPEHPLPCGHILCTACVKAYGKHTKSAVSLNCCPLHRESTKWAKPAVIKFKPWGAGVRVLALDGGGIRGVVQLEVLHAIEQCLGGRIQVQSFFDLVVGTGTGGLLAVALSTKNRTVDSCLDMFTAMCDHAFTPRLKGVPGLSQIVHALASGRKYKTKPLHAALRTAFSEDEDLFGYSSQLRSGIRVAVTTSSATGRESMLLASYRRADDVHPQYAFERPHEPEMELKVWETVAAALANPVYFRPFTFHGKTYLDGGVRSPNPSSIADRERRLIWPDAGEPDLFLSLGTGQNRIAILEKLSHRPKETIPDASVPDPGQSVEDARKASKKLFRKADEILEAEIAWQTFRASAVTGRSEAKGRRFIRFNPDLDKDPPAPDSKSDLENLQLTVRKRLQTPHRLAALRNVAHRLVASCFYLEVQSKAPGERSEQIINGTITCRFEDGSPEICALGKILEERKSDGFDPYFLIKPNTDSVDSTSILAMTPEIMRGMSDQGIFSLSNVQIPLREDTKSTSINLFLTGHDGLEPDGFPISGFPRSLLWEPAGAKPNPHRTIRDRISSDQFSIRTTLTSKHRNRASDVDSVSLNGLAKTSSSEEAWQETQNKFSYVPKSGHVKMSLADLIAQNQNTGPNGRQRTNRFWTYIGNHHMVQHPEMYTEEEIEKFAANSSIQLSELVSSATPTVSQTSLGTDSTSLGANSPWQEYATPSELHPQELEASDQAISDMQHEDDPIEEPPPRQSSLQERPNSQPRDSIPSQIETLFEDEDDDGYSAYSGQEAFAKASPVVQVRRRNTIDSVVTLYKTMGMKR